MASSAKEELIDLPPIRIERCNPSRREPGVMLFNVRKMSESKDTTFSGWLMALDQAGKVTCVHRSNRPVQGVRYQPDGNLLVSIIDGLLLEMTLGGQILRQWYATGRYRDRPPPDNAIAVEAETFHHGISLTRDGNLLLCSMEIRTYPDWPGSTTDPNVPRERARIVGDIIMEVARDGAKLHEWRLLDLLDPYRITYGSRANYWVHRGFAGTYDWCHANGTAHDARDDSLLVSLRTQDCIIKLDRKTGALRWILGAHGNWRYPWSDKLLTPVGELAWNFHQHDCSITPTGSIMCFDNGNHRSLPFAPTLPHLQNFSRAVEFEVDEAKRTVRQVWSYGEAPGERLFAGFQGGAARLPTTGNTFITYGGICSIGGEPVDEPDAAHIRARLIEVTPANEVVLDVLIGDERGDSISYSVFKSEFVPQTSLCS